ncbi:MAG TPA: regulator [Galbitalea sp.]|jgi:MinD-like ATPase involved in chromosome partitioning or flagellar assembly
MRVAFALPLEAEDRLVPQATRHGHEIVARCSTAHELASRIEAVNPDVAIVAATERHLTPSLVSICDEAGVRILPLVDGPLDRRHAATLGLLESAELAADWPTLERDLAVLPSKPTQLPDDIEDAPVAAPKGGAVIAVWGPAGAPGRTTIAINVAYELAAAGHSVALADVDTYSGSIAPALGMLDEAPGFAAACRLAGTDALTRAELERIGQRYGAGRTGFWVLTGIGRPSRWPELSALRVASTLQECRAWVDFTVVDTGFSLEHDEEISSDLFAPRRNAASITALREADRVIAVGAADPVGLSRFLRAHVDLLETVAEGRVIVAMNKVRASAIGLNPIGQVTQTLSRFGGIDSAAMIPHDPASLDAAILSGRTLADAAPRSPARSAIRDLVASRLLPPASSRKRTRALKAVRS